MRYDGKWENVPENVMRAKWLPQNDLLGHPKTVLYIAHGGNNGQTEAYYHAIPMVVLPFGGDQMYSAKRVDIKMVGKYLNPLDFSSDQLYEYVNEVITNPIYKNNIMKCSNIIKSFPSSHDKVDFWVKHVLQFSGDHLKPQYMDMPIYKYFMLDILFAILIIATVLVYLLAKLCMSIRRCVFKKRSKPKTE